MNTIIKQLIVTVLVMVMVFSAAACADTESAYDPYTLAQEKMSQPDTIISDVIAGIDRGSVTQEEGIIFFSAVMSDGAVVRFEGQNIAISDDGLTLYPGGSVTSLDAIGKIYQYDAQIKDHEQPPVSDQELSINYAYTFSNKKTSVTRASEIRTSELSGYPAIVWGGEATLSVAYYEPNFISFKSAAYNTEAFTLTSLTVGYNPSEKVTAITQVELNPSFYGYYTEGAPYNVAKEDLANEENYVYDFYLRLKPESLDAAGIDQRSYWLSFLPHSFYEAGDLLDAQGHVLDKETARVHAGDTLTVTIGDTQYAVPLPIAQQYEGAQTLKEARPYSTMCATGAQHVLVVPVVWADQAELASPDLYALYQKALGSIIDRQGNPVADFSAGDDGVFSLSEYFAISSYGQLEISSFMTDWYLTDKCFANEYEYIFPEIDFADEVLVWVKAAYPDTDWTQFDQDGDGCVDAMVLLSVGLTENEGYAPGSFGGAVHSTGSQYGERAGTQTDPQANCFLTVNYAFMKDGQTSTLIHEFSHNFGLNDYYDGTGTGINAVGGYDMQGDSVGDWNAYSKLAVGWMEPQVVSGLASGESIDLTISSSALKGDVILLPAAGTTYDGPFGEYVMIDLLTPDGANIYDAPAYGLENTVGVRISHVNATLRRVSQLEYSNGYMGDENLVIGMELFSNHYQSGNPGFYLIEVIQAGKTNTLTNLDFLSPILRAEDLFREGDTFTAEDYSQFFYQGLMDSGLPLGYTVHILSIGTDSEGQPTATIRITAS